jgi:hypothetical protein
VPPDVTPPTITLPSSVTAEAAGPSGTVVGYLATADDAVDGPVTPTCAPESGSTFAIGTTTVTCGAIDEAGNAARSAFDVVVRDTTAPVLAVPTAVTAEATSPAGASVALEASAADLVDGAVTPSCTPASGATFALGDTTVTCTAGDVRGNAASSSFTVSVVDTTPPTFDRVPALGAVEATGPAGAPVLYNVSTTDLVDGVVAPTCAPASGSMFAIGTTRVTCTATDRAGNASTTVFDAVVVDTTSPTLRVPGELTQEATSPSGAVVAFAASASDIVDGDVPVTCTPASATTFALGRTVVTCSTTDAHGNRAASGFGVTVRDTTAPVLALAGTAGVYDVDATVAITCAASDVVSRPTCSPPSITASSASFGAGVHTLTFTATDAAGNRGTATATFEVRPTVTGMIHLTDALVTKAQLASSLDAKLRAGSYQAYRQQLRAQAGAGITQADADLLTALSYALPPK